MQLFLFPKGIFPRLQTCGRCRGLPCFRQGSSWEQLVVLGASSIPLPSVWELHRIRTPKWLNLPRLCQRRDCVSIARLHLYQCQTYKQNYIVSKWYQSKLNYRSFHLETYFQGLQSWVSFHSFSVAQCEIVTRQRSVRVTLLTPTAWRTLRSASLLATRMTPASGKLIDKAM